MSAPAVMRLRRVRLVEVVREGEDDGAPVAGPGDAGALLRAVLPTDREGFAVVHLNGRHRVIGCELVSVGSLNASIVHPREVFKGALLANASSIILGHNHPSGDPDPSEEDLGITLRLEQAGEVLGLSVLDHVIIAGERSMSFSASGLLTRGRAL